MEDEKIEEVVKKEESPVKEISKKEARRRKKIKAAFEKRRLKGYKRYLRELRKEIKKRKEKEKRQKEKEKERRRKEREKKKHKRPVGRPKKRGPKKKYKRKKKTTIPKKVGAPVRPILYRIIACQNRVQKKVIGKYRSLDDAYNSFNNLKEIDKEVVFPVYIMGADKLDPVIYEYLLIEVGEGEAPKMRNEYGKLVEQKLNVDNWHIIDKYQFKKEETFWIFGYDNRSERKTFQWIYYNILLADIETKYDFKRVLIFKNKIIIKDDNNEMKIIFCKDERDAVRFYNLTEQWIKRDKLKQVLFIGDYSNRSPKQLELINEIMALTGWPRVKVTMKNTSFNLKN